jgi:hypothetical protein
MTKFPIKPTALWRQIYPALLVGALLSRGYDWLMGGQFSLPNMLLLMGFASFYVVYSHLFYPMLAGPSGLRLINGWGLRRSVAWADIVEVRHARQFGIIPSLRVRCANGRVYWIGTEVSNLAELYALATESGGPDHPLALALATPQYALR